MPVTSNYIETAEGATVWTNPSNCRTHDTSWATAAPAKNGNLTQIFTTFGITDPGGTVSIDKVEVGLDWYVSTSASIATQSAAASYNGGTNWTADATMDTATTESHLADGGDIHYLDVTAGRAWTWAELNNTNFQVRVAAIRGNSSTAVTFSYNVIYVRITYTVAATITKGSLARFKKATTVTLTSSGRFKKPATLTLDSYSRFKKAFTITLNSMAAFVAGMGSHTITLDSMARFKKALLITLNSNARFRKPTTKTLDSLARFKKAATLTLSSSARFKVPALITKDSYTRFKKTQTITKDSMARFGTTGGGYYYGAVETLRPEYTNQVVWLE